ncbi:MAG TPA: phospholipase D-like domain-containing protein [Ktedonobacteraceae bacterium]|jgi:phosphatidylserine/phosphatidylglycerophosphate/cardiolipin synthase-like enzyme
MGERYLEVLWRARQVLDAIEAWLGNLPDRSQVSIHRIRKEIHTPPLSYAQAAMAANALIEIGIIEQQPDPVLNQRRLLETEIYRLSLRHGMDYTRAHMPAPPAQFLVALPPGLSQHTQYAITADARDLRAGLIGLLTEAQEHLLLASPFWDEKTIIDLGAILERRLHGGIRIDLLVRTITHPNNQRPAFARGMGRLAQHAGCRIWTWNIPLATDHFGTQTFHFKCIIADYGKQAYLGSANFTLASFRSRMELGILLAGDAARTLSHLVTQTLGIAQLWKG